MTAMNVSEQVLSDREFECLTSRASSEIQTSTQILYSSYFMSLILIIDKAVHFLALFSLNNWHYLIHS